ncbi:MAG TPA: metallophosphoesterase family protein [Bacteroidales bacterium]|nr:metallophosphoesterase family protein [Bacteroidales bacterium]
MRIGLLSDTHGWIHPSLFTFFEKVDEIWHAGDIGNIETAGNLASFRPLKAVYGNIDGGDLRRTYPSELRFMAGEKRVWIRHIGGYPGRYDPSVRMELMDDPPDLFICGHSHIARIIYDKKLGLLFINPGAAGFYGFHKIMTAVRFSIDGKDIHSLELIELGERGKVIS